MKPEISSREFAKNLRKPRGEKGIKVAEFMHIGNANFYNQLYKNVNWKKGMRILEIGFGGGKHITELVSHAQNIKYVGVDYSKTMVDEGKKNNPEFKFYNQNVLELDLSSEQNFDLIVTINTVYFIEDLGLMIRNLKSCLADGGEIHIGKRTKEDMVKLEEITQYNFIRYSNMEVVKAIIDQNLNVSRMTSAIDTEFERKGIKTTLHSDFIIAA